LAQGRSLREAVVWGAAAGALSATKAGAQPSLPDRKTFEAFLKERGLTYSPCLELGDS
jgi:ribokinase